LIDLWIIVPLFVQLVAIVGHKYRAPFVLFK
jgi:hypothetical protein